MGLSFIGWTRHWIYLDTPVLTNEYVSLLILSTLLVLLVSADKRVQKILYQTRHLTQIIRFIPDIFHYRLLNHSVSEIAGIPIININGSPISYRANDTFMQATKNDDRITPIGKFIRRTSIDELPQFFNVLQGRMSIVGPGQRFPRRDRHSREIGEADRVRSLLHRKLVDSSGSPNHSADDL